MAKYTINYQCGHQGEVQLVGKISERERRIAWMEQGECPKCWGEKKRAEEEAQPITATLRTNGVDTDSNGNVLVEIVLSGGTRPRKEEIKNMGYHWGDVHGGVMDMLSTHAPQQGWIKKIALVDLDNEEIAKKIEDELKSIGATVVAKISALDYEMARKKIIEKNEIDEQLAALQKPARPACRPDGKWNKTVYGSERNGYRIYIDNVERKISAADAKILTQYIEDIKRYNDAVEKIKSGK